MANKQLLPRYLTILVIAGGGLCLALWTRTEKDPTPALLSSSLRSVGNQPSPQETDAVLLAKPSVNKSLQLKTTSSTSSAVKGALIVSEPMIATETLPFDLMASGKWLPSIAQPINRADLACPADGPLAEMLVIEGQEVQCGQKLAMIDNRIALASVAAAESTASRNAMLASARAKVKLAEQYLNRLQIAAKKNAASGVELDEAQSRLDEALAQVQEGLEFQRESHARLLVENARRDSHQLQAPFRGTVVKIHCNLGETIGREQTLITMMDVETLRAELFIPISQIGAIRKGHDVSLVAELPGNPKLIGKIVHIDPIIDAATSTVRGVVEIENHSRELPAGFAIRVLLPATVGDVASVVSVIQDAFPGKSF